MPLNTAKRLLLIDGNVAAHRNNARRHGVRTASGVYLDAIRAEFPHIGVDIIYAADPDAALPPGAALSDYDGLVIAGSALHAYDNDRAVTDQIALVRQFAETGAAILGSCWGLQIAAIAAGGSVGPSPRGREVGIARKIVATPAGQAHPLLTGRVGAFDAPCIHYDEVQSLPDGATILCCNAHSPIQGAIIPLGRSQVWAVQYHPEFDVAHIADILELYGAAMIDQGFFADEGALKLYSDRLRRLEREPDNRGIAWQLGLDSDISDGYRRRTEIRNWIEYRIKR